MTDLNSVHLVGRLVRDSELKYTSGGAAQCRFSIAVNRSVKKGDSWTDEVSYFDLNLWGKQAEGLGKHLTKGKQVAVSGVLRQNRWEKDGQTMSKVEIQIENIQLLGGASGGNKSPTEVDYDQARGGKVNQAAENAFEDDIPF